MSWLLEHFHWFALILIGLNALIVLSAAFEAGRLKSNGQAPEAPDNFLLPMLDALGSRFLAHLYWTDTRRLYRSRWIDACVRAARVTMPLSAIAMLVTIALLFTGKTG